MSAKVYEQIQYLIAYAVLTYFCVDIIVGVMLAVPEWLSRLYDRVRDRWW